MPSSALGGEARGISVSALSAPGTCIDLTSLVCPFCPNLLYFAIVMLAAAAPAHFPLFHIDVPSVDVRPALCFLPFVFRGMVF